MFAKCERVAENRALLKSLINFCRWNFSAYFEQIALVSQSSIIVGMHGAGIALALHMSVGTKYCCGVLELYPTGEYSPIRGHGNMLRRMGVHYDRIDIAAEDSLSTGAKIPVEEMSQKILAMLGTIHQQPTCVVRRAYEDPYLESIGNM